MARDQEWRNDVRGALRHEGWSLHGPMRIVKVVSAGRPVASALKGFVCLEKSLLGKTPAAIEGLLGLPPGAFHAGCRIYRLTRLPMQSEVDYELTAAFPNGLAYNAAVHDPSYLPGSRSIHQWRLLVDVPAQHLLDLAPGQTYPYLHA